jgi:hypothetical protein
MSTLGSSAQNASTHCHVGLALVLSLCLAEGDNACPLRELGSQFAILVLFDVTVRSCKCVHFSSLQHSSLDVFSALCQGPANREN